MLAIIRPPGAERQSLVDQRAGQVVDRVERAQADDQAKPPKGYGASDRAIAGSATVTRQPRRSSSRPRSAAPLPSTSARAGSSMQEADPVLHVLDHRSASQLAPARRAAEQARTRGPRIEAAGAENGRRSGSGGHREHPCARRARACKTAALTRMRAARLIAESLAPVVDLVFPPRCPLCGAAIGAQTGLCAACWATLRIPGEPACAPCQRPLEGTAAEAGAVCAPCLADPPRHDGIAAGTLYDEPSRKLVLAFKHGRRIALAPMLARLIAARLPVLEGEWLMVPVPLHRWRLWSRGYNQAALLARELARLAGQTLAVDALVRTRAHADARRAGAESAHAGARRSAGDQPALRRAAEGARTSSSSTTC